MLEDVQNKSCYSSLPAILAYGNSSETLGLKWRHHTPHIFRTYTFPAVGTVPVSIILSRRAELTTPRDIVKPVPIFFRSILSSSRGRIPEHCLRSGPTVHARLRLFRKRLSILYGWYIGDGIPAVSPRLAHRLRWWTAGRLRAGSCCCGFSHQNPHPPCSTTPATYHVQQTFYYYVRE